MRIWISNCQRSKVILFQQDSADGIFKVSMRARELPFLSKKIRLFSTISDYCMDFQSQQIRQQLIWLLFLCIFSKVFFLFQQKRELTNQLSLVQSVFTSMSKSKERRKLLPTTFNTPVYMRYDNFESWKFYKVLLTYLFITTPVFREPWFQVIYRINRFPGQKMSVIIIQFNYVYPHKIEE